MAKTRQGFWWALTGAVVLFMIVNRKKIMDAVGYLHGKPVDLKLAKVPGGKYLRDDAAAAFVALVTAAKKDGLSLSARDGFRTMAEQEEMKKQWTAKGEPQKAATPGYSNHQGGTAVDVQGGDLHDKGFDSGVYLWLSANAPRFGFTNDEGKAVKEHWHWCFVKAPTAPIPPLVA